jgi:hypothetical protein
MASKNNQTAREIFRKVVKGSNVFTPTVLAYEVAGNYVVELSKGEAIKSKPTDSDEWFGVTVVDRIAKEHRHDLSQVFGNRTLARKYINQLAQL